MLLLYYSCICWFVQFAHAGCKTGFMSQDFGRESGYWQDFGKKSRYALKVFLFLFGFSIMAQLKAFPTAPPKTPDLTWLGNCNAGFASKIPRAPGLMRLTITSDTLGTFPIQSKLKTFAFSPVRFQTNLSVTNWNPLDTNA